VARRQCPDCLVNTGAPLDEAEANFSRYSSRGKPARQPRYPVIIGVPRRSPCAVSNSAKGLILVSHVMFARATRAGRLSRPYNVHLAVECCEPFTLKRL